MRHEMHHEKRAFGGAAARAKGGPVEERMAELHADSKEGKDDEKYDGKGSDVEKESEVDGYGGHKRGGHVKKAAGGAVARKRGGKVHHGSMPMHVEGKHPAHRMDRPGRKRGGGGRRAAGVGRGGLRRGRGTRSRSWWRRCWCTRCGCR